MTQETVRTTHLKKGKRNRAVEQLSQLNVVPANARSPQGESQLYIFEDNEAVIKMTKEKVRQLDMCQEPTELQLISCLT